MVKNMQDLSKCVRKGSVVAPVELTGVVSQEVVHALLSSHHCESELGLVVDLSK